MGNFILFLGYTHPKNRFKRLVWQKIGIAIEKTVNNLDLIH
ncbi:hypothetical protein FM109_03720 [Vibrio casei]|nr:hypothetical protein FM109_03720 [Vibrio casei]